MKGAALLVPQLGTPLWNSFIKVSESHDDVGRRHWLAQSEKVMKNLLWTHG